MAQVKDKHPLSINILKLQRYNFNFLKCEEVVFFEFLVVKGASFKYKPFYQSSETIFRETGIRKHSLQTIISRFESLGYISIEIKGMPKVKHFSVHYPIIHNDLERIYLLTENGKPLYDFRKLLADFYQPLTENYLKKNNKSILKENKKEKIDIISEEVTLDLKKFDEALATLKLQLNLSSIQCNYSDGLMIKALQHYTVEELQHYLSVYFSDGYRKKISDFLKFDQLAPNQLVYIEKKRVEEEKYLDTFIDSLQQLYDARINIYNEDKKYKRAKSQTKLVINRNIKTKLQVALNDKGEVAIRNAFLAYTDQVLKGDISPSKFLPYFLSKNYGEYGVIDTYLDYYNLEYGYNK